MKGLGTDIIEIARIHSSIEDFKDVFLKKHFTENEICYCLKYPHPAERFAGRFAAKEAIVKALGTGFVGISFLDIEILNNENGAPEVFFLKPQFKHFQVLLSISHCKLFAVATALIL